MNVLTVIPWHVYLTMFLFAVIVGLLTAFEVEDLRTGRPAVPRRRDPSDEVKEA